MGALRMYYYTDGVELWDSGYKKQCGNYSFHYYSLSSRRPPPSLFEASFLFPFPCPIQLDPLRYFGLVLINPKRIGRRRESVLARLALPLPHPPRSVVLSVLAHLLCGLLTSQW